MMDTYIQLASAMFGSLSFALLYNVRGKKLIGAAVGGLVVWGAYLLLMMWLRSSTLSTTLAALLAYLYAQLLARKTKSPSTVYLAPSLIPLVPGGSLYYTMYAAVMGDWALSFEHGVHTLRLTGAIAVALTIGASFALAKSSKRNTPNMTKKII